MNRYQILHSLFEKDKKYTIKELSELTGYSSRTLWNAFYELQNPPMKLEIKKEKINGKLFLSKEAV